MNISKSNKREIERLMALSEDDLLYELGNELMKNEVQSAERTFTKTEVWKIARKAMNMGMELRQNQLQGQGGDKSGDELLKEYLDKL